MWEKASVTYKGGEEAKQQQSRARTEQRDGFVHIKKCRRKAAAIKGTGTSCEMAKDGF
jgi:hypothetical protein